MAESNSGKYYMAHASKIPDFLSAMVSGSYNIHDAGRNLSQLQDQTPLHKWTNHGPSQFHRQPRMIVGQTSHDFKSRASSPGDGEGQSAYHSYLALSQCLPPDTNMTDAAFLKTFYPPQDVLDPLHGRCSTPDVLKTVLQMDAHEVSPIGKMDALGSSSSSPPAQLSLSDSPSIWRSPGGREYMDSGYLSEDSLPACIYQSKPHHSNNDSTSKIPAFAPTFYPIASRKSSQNPDDLKVFATNTVTPRVHIKNEMKNLSENALEIGSHYHVNTKYEPLSQVQSAQITSEISPVHPQVEEKPSEMHLQLAVISTSQDQSQGGTGGQSISDSKPMKRKHSEFDPTNNTESYSRNMKRGRHNEPLHQKAVLFMTDWYNAHSDNPYPNKEEKNKMAAQGGISVSQVKSWFANKRNRSNNTRPKVQKQQLQDRLLSLCHKLAKDQQQSVDNTFVIQQLSTLISTSR